MPPSGKPKRSTHVLENGSTPDEIARQAIEFSLRSSISDFESMVARKLEN
jgi:hypothetical protein